MGQYYRKRHGGKILLACMLLLISVEAKDYTNHWAEQTIDEWAASGVIKGEGEGVFNPDGYVTRAELAAFIKRIFQYQTPEQPRYYSDIEIGSWYEASAIDVASQGIMYLPGDTFVPQQKVTRQEVAYALAKVYSLKGTSEQPLLFNDAQTIAPWALDGVQALVQGGFLRGYPDGHFKPEGFITRAEMITLIDQLTACYYYIPGTYTQDIEGNVVINSTDVILKDMTIDGNLYITEGAGVSPIVLDGVTVTGEVSIQGGTVRLSGLYDTISIHTSGEVIFEEGTARQMSIEGEGAPITLQKGTTITYLLTTNTREIVTQGDVAYSSDSEHESLQIEAAGVYMGDTFVPVEVAGDTITIDLLELIEEAPSDVMDSLIIYTNKDEAYLVGYDDTGKLATNTRYTFRRADQELGIIDGVLEEIRHTYQEIDAIATSIGVTADTVFSMISQNERISLSYLMNQYDYAVQIIEEFTGVALEDTYSIRCKLYHPESESQLITIKLQVR